jgi:anti-anti-sigma factor
VPPTSSTSWDEEARSGIVRDQVHIVFAQSFLSATTFLAEPSDEAGAPGAPAASPGADLEVPLVVHASGELDLKTVEPFRVLVTKAVNSASSARVIVDLRDVTFIDSTALGVLVRAHNRLTTQKRHLTVRTQHPLVLHLFEITGLTALLDIED